MHGRNLRASVTAHGRSSVHHEVLKPNEYISKFAHFYRFLGYISHICTGATVTYRILTVLYPSNPPALGVINL